MYSHDVRCTTELACVSLTIVNRKKGKSYRNENEYYKYINIYTYTLHTCCLAISFSFKLNYRVQMLPRTLKKIQITVYYCRKNNKKMKKKKK